MIRKWLANGEGEDKAERTNKIRSEDKNRHI